MRIITFSPDKNSYALTALSMFQELFYTLGI